MVYSCAQDMYLRQLERENRIKEVYGADVVLVQPKPMFVVKTRAIGGKKCFINMTGTY